MSAGEDYGPLTLTFTFARTDHKADDNSKMKFSTKIPTKLSMAVRRPSKPSFSTRNMLNILV